MTVARTQAAGPKSATSRTAVSTPVHPRTKSQTTQYFPYFSVPNAGVCIELVHPQTQARDARAADGAPETTA